MHWFKSTALIMALLTAMVGCASNGTNPNEAAAVQLDKEGVIAHVSGKSLIPLVPLYQHLV